MNNKSDSYSSNEELLNVLICNGSLYFLQVYESLLRYIAYKNKYLVSILLYENGKEAVFCKDDWINEPDILIIGWESNEIRGIEIARAFKKDHCYVKIFFISCEAKKDVIESFGVNPFYFFIDEEINHKKFEMVFQKCVRDIKERKNHSLKITNNGKVQHIPFEMIIYLKVDHRMINIKCCNMEKFVFYESLKNMEERIKEKNFMRIHRAYIVNLRYVNYICKNELFLTNHDSIPISREYKQQLIERLVKEEKIVTIKKR